VKLAAPALLLLSLAACGDPSPDAAAGNRDAPAERAALSPTQQRVVDMPEGQRNGVLMRAIVDGGQPCQGVTLAARQPDEGGRPTWAARCANGASYRLSIGPDGTAQVTLVGDRAAGAKG